MILEGMLWCAKPMVHGAVVDVCATWREGPHLEEERAKALFSEAWARYNAASQELPEEPTLGGRLNIRLASLTLEFVRALEAAGFGQAEAIRVTREVAWRLYRRWASIPKAWGRLVGRGASERMNRTVRAFLRFPFSEPSYRWDVSERDGVVCLDVRRCPVADFFVREEVGEVCAGTWCRLDYPLAEYWGGRYERDGTLSEGDEACHMRWISDDAEQVNDRRTGR